ncbi:hypothetical protein N9L02_01980, partial [Gammaproteobacteria bacterium]|nr:hypothetical protein [Gammaproteobacteria bacterium]
MVKFIKYISIFIIFFQLTSCASVRMAEEVQLGKSTFNSGNFKLAFQQLMPLAVKCNSEAEYAVGYMYYYGLGLEAHKESGIFWINRSASQMYRPAIKAMQLIRQNEILEKTKPVTKSKEYSKLKLIDYLKTSYLQDRISKSESEDVNEQISGNDDTDLNEKITEDNSAVALNIIKEKITKKNMIKEALNQRFNDKRKSLEVFGSYSSSKVLQMQNNMHLENFTKVTKTKQNGRDWFVLAYSDDKAKSLSKLAKESSAKEVTVTKPWDESTGALRWIG